METIETRVITTIKARTEKLQGDQKVKEYIEANEDFNKMVDLGLANRRGNRLLPFEKFHLTIIPFNSR